MFAACHDAAPPPAAKPAPQAPAGPDLGDPYALLPADSDVIVRLDFAALRESSLWSKYKSAVFELIAPTSAACADSPLDGLTLVTAGLPVSDKLGVFVIHGLDQDRFVRCMHVSSPESNETATFDGNFITFTNKSGAVNMMTFVDAHTAVAQGSEHPTKQTLTQALTVGAPLHQDAELAAIEKTLAPHPALTLIFRPQSKAGKDMLAQRVGPAVRVMYGTLHVTDHLELHVTFELASADNAAAVVAAMQPKLAQLKPFVDRIEETSDGATVHMNVAVTEDQLKLIVGQIKAAMGNN